MLLVVCGLEDESALWFARRAAQSGVPCRIVTTEALSYARRFSHRLENGEVRTAEPDCLAGPLRHPFVMVAAAHAAGLPCPEVRFDTTGPLGPADALLLAAAQAAGPQARPVHLVCLDGAVLGCEPPEPVAAGIAAFAARMRAGTALLGIDFFAGAGGWWFAGASPLPDLRAGDDALCHRLLGLLAPNRVAVPS